MPEDELGPTARAANEQAADEAAGAMVGRLADELRLQLLYSGTIDIEGRMPWSSNATFLVNVALPDDEPPNTVRPGNVWRDGAGRDGAGRDGAGRCGQAIYKPLRGERPLWDFEPGLFRREVAAYQLSEAMGFHVVPPTIVRDGPLGEGSMQWFVDADHQEHYFTIYEKREDLHDRLRLMAVLDIVANNTDRKSGHCLLARDDRIWGIDHGLCFAAQSKLRTVIWEFGGEPIPDAAIAPLQALADRVPRGIAALLSTDEVAAIRKRAAWLLERGTLPTDETGRRYPWPLV